MTVDMTERLSRGDLEARIDTFIFDAELSMLLDAAVVREDAVAQEEERW